MGSSIFVAASRNENDPAPGISIPKGCGDSLCQQAPVCRKPGAEGYQQPWLMWC